MTLIAHHWLAVLIVLLILAAFARFMVWAFIPHRQLPGNRVRHNRIRIRLRLHPGRGHATVVELWLRWGRFAAFRRSGKVRPSLPFWARVMIGAAAYSIMLGRAHYRHGMRVPLEEHVLVMAPPRTGKTGWLARIIIHYPGPVLSTTTKPDVYGLTSGIRARSGRPVEVFNPPASAAYPARSGGRRSPGALTGRSPSAARTASPTRSTWARTANCSRTLPGPTCGRCSTRRPWPAGTCAWCPCGP